MRVLPLACAALLAAGSALAALKTETVEYKFGDDIFVGYLVWSDTGAEERRPGVLVVHEWMGLDDYARQRANQLAELGYVAFAVDLFGRGRNAANVDEAKALTGALYKDIPLLRNRLNAGLEMLANRPEVDPARIAAIGYCFGGRAVLELARSGANIAGVVSFHGGLAAENRTDAKAIKCRVLVEHGGADPFVSADDFQGFVKEMNDAGVNWHMDVYGNAVHGFTNPKNSGDPAQGVAYHAEADRESWAAMQRFFDEILKVKS